MNLFRAEEMRADQPPPKAYGRSKQKSPAIAGHLLKTSLRKHSA
jgi:hypothetical protein